MAGRYASLIRSTCFTFRHSGSSCLDGTHCSAGSNNATAEFVNLLGTNPVDIDQALFANFDYNEMQGGVDDNSGEDEVEEVDEGVYEQAQAKKVRDRRTIRCWKTKS